MEKKNENVLDEKKIKIIIKSYASTYNVNILNPFNLNCNLKILNLQLKVS